jgi:hypothetical protein
MSLGPPGRQAYNKQVPLHSPVPKQLPGLLSRLLAKSAHAGRELNSRVLEDRRCSEDQVNLGTVPKFLCRELAAFDCGQNARGELVGEFCNPVDVRSLGPRSVAPSISSTERGGRSS